MTELSQILWTSTVEAQKTTTPSNSIYCQGVFVRLRKQQPVVMINGPAVLRFTAYLIFVKNESGCLFKSLGKT